TDFIQILDAPLGFGEGYEASLDEVRQRIMELNIPVRDTEENRVHFSDVAKALAARVAREAFGGDIESKGGSSSIRREEVGSSGRKL
ncbi:unnamed protein product, partial [Discosporangium mesarthrocarpum]